MTYSVLVWLPHRFCLVAHSCIIVLKDFPLLYYVFLHFETPMGGEIQVTSENL